MGDHEDLVPFSLLTLLFPFCLWPTLGEDLASRPCELSPSERLNPAPIGFRVQSRTLDAGSAVAETFKIGFVYFVLFSLFLLVALVKHF